MPIGNASAQVKRITEKLRMKESSRRSPTTVLHRQVVLEGPARVALSRPEKPFSPGQTPTQMRVLLDERPVEAVLLAQELGLLRARLSPWLCSSAIWLERKSPGGSWMMTKVTKLITSSVGIMISTRRRRVALSIHLNQNVSGR